MSRLDHAIMRMMLHLTGKDRVAEVMPVKALPGAFVIPSCTLVAFGPVIISVMRPGQLVLDVHSEYWGSEGDALTVIALTREELDAGPHVGRLHDLIVGKLGLPPPRPVEHSIWAGLVARLIADAERREKLLSFKAADAPRN